LRKDTLSHAYELLKVDDPKKRRRLASQVASGELSLVKHREKIEGRRPRVIAVVDDTPIDDRAAEVPEPVAEEPEWSTPGRIQAAMSDDSLINARHHLSDAVEDLVSVLRAPDVIRGIAEVDRTNLAKYLTIAKLKLENAIALVRSGDGG
jgi:hypothetical protein